jgi:Arc/MetJ family transcription regulator
LNSSSYDAISDDLGANAMRTTVVLDDDLVRKAIELSGIEERTSLLREALQALISREAALRLSAMYGALPDIELPPRRQFREGDFSFEFDPKRPEGQV